MFPFPEKPQNPSCMLVLMFPSQDCSGNDRGPWSWRWLEYSTTVGTSLACGHGVVRILALPHSSPVILGKSFICSKASLSSSKMDGHDRSNSATSG